MMHASVISVEQDLPWTFVVPQSDTKFPPTTKPHLSKDMSGPIFIDGSSATYALFHSTPLSPVNQFHHVGGSEPSFISDEEDLLPSKTLPILPLSSTTLIRNSANRGYSSISMLHIHLLHIAKSPGSSLTIPDAQTHKEITRNYHELAVLAAARWQLHANAILPFHLGALEVMNSALLRAGDLDCLI
jgi:mediator of RNA polymerase II transcription subunit 13